MHTIVKRFRFLRFFAVAAIAAIPLGVVASQPLQGNVLLTRDSKDPIAVWQASQEIYAMIGDGAPQKEINARLEHDGLHAAASILTALKPLSGTLTLHIVYSKMTADGLNYKVFTLAGATDYAVLRLPVRDAVRNRDRWTSLASRSPVPKWIRYQVIGKLPGQ